jgi:hypothetical protein
MYEFNKTELNGELKNPEIINFIFAGIPSLVQAAFTFKDEYYFFKDDLFVRFYSLII